MIVREYEPGDSDTCGALFQELLRAHRDLYADATIAGEFAL